MALGYLFFGVSIVADRFMAAIEVITSQEKVVKLRKPNGEEYTVLVRVWNETVSNLTLMALGSSAPEILLSVIEIFGNNFEAGELGPGTIVGSAAFNLFVIVAICIYVIPEPEIRRIYRYDVFWVTVLWSSFAYVWLYLILAVFSPNVVEVWEGVLTFLFFPLTVMSAYFANLYTHNFGQRILATPMASFVRRTPNRVPDKDKNDVTLEKGENLNTALMGNRSAPKEEVAFDTHKKRYLDIFRQLRTENPDMTIDELEILATDQIVKEAPKSRAFYRIQATHKMMGAGDLTLKAEKQLIRKKSNQSQNSYMPEKPKVITVQFDPVNYMCLENIGTLKLNVKCDRGSIEVPTRVSVHYKTVADTAQEDDDFIPVEGDLIFKPGETLKHIEVGIIDNDVYEEDEQFHVRLSNIKAVCDTNEQQTIKAELGINSLATVLIIDDDHGGAFTFNNEYFKVPENQGVFILEVTRHRGARGKVTIPYRTIDGAAKNGEDYVGHHDGSLTFEDGQTKALIEIEIINDDEYEKSEDFYVELSDPIWVTDYGLGEGGADGRPVLGAHTRCRIDIIEDMAFKGFVDRLVANANVSLMVGTHSWRQQFRDAFTIEDLDEDGQLSGREKFLHYVSFPWKLIFALIPPTDYFSGWLSFCVSIFAIGVVTAIIGDVASHLGCTIGLKDSITAITLVALGTSLPGMFKN
uniref:Calx-beta domain-containing protein n=2 Tax=Panagrolaimus sp. ES5 TaxID=591445 RepID=A0AC34FNK9_9BILA